ncbi:hypothetical protein MtrunA17_Chr1g0179721 [Medicago truncatula]|uniref:Uncharacterized protein n=1 Tax=Medicago truncatula TaxID=3880 RepID=A0A396JMZ0_MEDTR|nr:hypothetical protein MtrunA17_Chr1g0179721 [Medicago truncatula]
MTRQQILLTKLSEGPIVEESYIVGTKSKLFFYKDQNRNSLILQGRKEVLTLISIAGAFVLTFYKGPSIMNSSSLHQPIGFLKSMDSVFKIYGQICHYLHMEYGQIWRFAKYMVGGCSCSVGICDIYLENERNDLGKEQNSTSSISAVVLVGTNMVAPAADERGQSPTLLGFEMMKVAL